MINKSLKNNLLILFLFLLVGIMVHFKSFQMVPYGDDWTFIYDYYAKEQKDLHVNINLPGFLSFLTPYGPSILEMGVIYHFFGNSYFIYYLVPIIFKALAAFFLFLFLRNISNYLKAGNSLTNLLGPLLFVIGMTGIQAIDWIMNSYVYIAVSIFSLSLYFLSKFYINEGIRNLVTSFFLAALTILIAPTRFTPFAIIFPLIDLVLVFKKRQKSFTKKIFVKNFVFIILMYLFFRLGIFGTPGFINNTGRIPEFINGVSADIHLSFVMFMHWVGVTILPIFPTSHIYLTSLIGALFLGLLIWVLYRSRNEWLIIGSLIYFITLGIMWMISPLKVTDSLDRYLVVSFFSLCFLIGLLTIMLKRLNKLLVIILVLLFAVQIYSVDKIYSSWLALGRGKDFIIPVQNKIMSYFPTPFSDVKFILLDFDDGAYQQSVVFGLGYRIAVLSGTKNVNPLPTAFINKTTLQQAIQEEIKKGRSEEKVINNVIAFEFKNKIFTDITFIVREELKKDI